MRFVCRYLLYILSTIAHRFWVFIYMLKFCCVLLLSALKHDLSKFRFVEARFFAKSPFVFKNLTYGSDEYKAALKMVKPALEEHYKVNRHHPEYFMQHHHTERMTLVDRIEMVIDWKAAQRRHKDGCVVKSVQVNQERFGYDEKEFHMYLDIANAISNKEDKRKISELR